MARLNLVKSSSEVPESLTSQLSLSKIKSATDNRPEPFSITWPEFIESFRVPVTRGALPLDAYLSAEKSVRDQQKDGPAIIPGAYSKPGTRKQEDLESLSLVTLDIDESSRTFAEVCAALEELGLECLIHTSYSHSLDKPKHRAFILLKQPITAQIKATLERIIDFFDDRIGNIDPCCRKPGQLFFTPACPPGGEAFYQFRHLAGTPLDPADFPEVPAQAQTKAAPNAAAGTATRPGEDYSAKESCGELLELCGWQRFYSTGSVTHYTRPGKNFGVSATVFHESKNLYIHTSAPEAAPFECGKSYTPFGAYALIHHGGDHAAAARDLGRQGYGDQAVKQTAPGATAPEVIPPAERKALFISATEMLSQTVKVYPLVGKLIERHSTCVIFGQSGGGKTFVTLDMACAVASGGMWNGHQCEKGMVLYFVGEGYYGVVRRTHARHKHSGSPDLSNLHFSRSIITFDAMGLNQVVAEIRELEAHTGQHVALIVIDTLARHLEGDENSTKDMSAFIRRLNGLCNEFPGSTSMVVHHSGKNAEKSDDPRGAGALKAACEFVVQCDSGLLTYRKVKDGELPEPDLFKLVQVEVGTDEDGEPITSCIVEYGVQAAHHRNATNAKKFSAAEQEAIKALITASSGPLKEEDGGGMWGARIGDWRDSFKALKRLKDPDISDNTLKVAVARVVKSLLAKGAIREDGPLRVLVEEEHQANIRAAIFTEKMPSRVQGT